MAENKTVTFAEPEDQATGNESASTSVDEAAIERRRIMREELARMKERDENALARKRHRRLKAVKEAKAQMHRDKKEKGITILPETAACRAIIRKDVEDERRLSLKAKQEALKEQESRLQATIDDKLGLTTLPKGKELVSLAADFYNNNNLAHQHLPSHIRGALTTEEIDDLRLVFELFDAKNKGYITADDLRQVAAMLGYTAKKKVFKEMISEITTKDKKGRVTFVSFLDLVVRLQSDGPDPYEEMQRGFRLLDKGNKGYLTSSDLRNASETLGVPLSNRAIREMMEEADLTGDGKVTVSEFTRVIAQAATFTAPSS